jgi:hypothetical protein
MLTFRLVGRSVVIYTLTQIEKSVLCPPPVKVASEEIGHGQCRFPKKMTLMLFHESTVFDLTGAATPVALERAVYKMEPSDEFQLTGFRHHGSHR